MPQGKTLVRVLTAPKRPVKRNYPRLTYSGPPIVRTPVEILAIIRQRCAGILSDVELALVLAPPRHTGGSGRPNPVGAAPQRRRRL